jgi:hypothetical protein
MAMMAGNSNPTLAERLAWGWHRRQLVRARRESLSGEYVDMIDALAAANGEATPYRAGERPSC